MVIFSFQNDLLNYTHISVEVPSASYPPNTFYQKFVFKLFCWLLNGILIGFNLHFLYHQWNWTSFNNYWPLWCFEVLDQIFCHFLPILLGKFCWFLGIFRNSLCILTMNSLSANITNIFFHYVRRPRLEGDYLLFSRLILYSSICLPAYLHHLVINVK